MKTRGIEAVGMKEECMNPYQEEALAASESVRIMKGGLK